MARIKKKGQAGQAKNYMTRTQAVRKLQISLPDFRRLCIFKGIYPREPRNKKKASKVSSYTTTFYYTKDIQYLLHEPLLQKFREQKTLAKKIAKSLGRNEVGDAARLEKNAAPKISLDHIVRERYPTFVDALRDLDDALSLLFLFASLPSTSTVPPKIIARCQRLCHEFEHYLIVSRSLRKSFLSIKGIYYQATIQGQDIMWLVPYRFVQRVSGDVDYRIMGTFVEFYATLLGFVNFRLYTSIGLVYPPKFDAVADAQGGELAAFKLEGRKIAEQDDTTTQLSLTNGEARSQNTVEVQQQIDAVKDADEPQLPPQVEEVDPNDEAIDKFEPAAPQGDELVQPEMSGNEAASLFAPFTFYISREAPRHPIEFLLRAFGSKRVGWDAFLGDGAFTHDESDSRITHQVVDRPPPQESTLSTSRNGEANSRIRPGLRIPGRTYVQPQWVWDSINEGRLLRPDLYAPGATLPPHLSPWVKSTQGQYDPRAPLAEQEQEGEADSAEELEDEESEELEEAEDELDEEDLEVSASSVDGGMDVANSEEDDEDEAEDSRPEEDDFAGFEDEEVDGESEDETEDTRTAHQKELEAEAAGLPFTNSSGPGMGPKTRIEQAKNLSKKQRKEAEELERRKLMMPRKKRKLFEKMQYSNNKRDVEAQKLRAKRRKLEKADP